MSELTTPMHFFPSTAGLGSLSVDLGRPIAPFVCLRIGVSDLRALCLSDWLKVSDLRPLIG